jgi:hypothetical protein
LKTYENYCKCDERSIIVIKSSFPINWISLTIYIVRLPLYIYIYICMQVTWVEHAEVEEKPVHQIFSEYVYSGMAFGAQRWLAVLQRQCERAASLMARNISDLGGYFLSFLFFFLFLRSLLYIYIYLTTQIASIYTNISAKIWSTLHEH